MEYYVTTLDAPRGDIKLENNTLATEMLKEERAKATRWKTAFFVALTLLAITVGAIITYITIK